MRKIWDVSRRQLVWIGVAGLLLVVGCNKQPPANIAVPPAGPAQSSAAPAPPPAGGPANQEAAGTPGTEPATGTTVTQPTAAPQQTAPAPVPALATAPVPPPPPPVYTVPGGTKLSVSIDQAISAKNSNVGDRFRGSLAQSVHIDGVTVLKRGTPVSGTVIAAKGQGKFKGEGALGITLTSVGSRSVATSDYEKSVSGKGKRSTGLIAGGGGGGALIGGLAGGGKGALIGGLIGAGAGTAGAALTGNKDVVIPAESVVTFTLRSSIRIEGKTLAAK